MSLRKICVQLNPVCPVRPVSSPSPGLLPSCTGVETIDSTSSAAGAAVLEPFALTSATVKPDDVTVATRKSAESSFTTTSVPTFSFARSAAEADSVPDETAVTVTLRPVSWSSSHSCFCCVASSLGLKRLIKRGSSLITVESTSERSRFLFWKL